MGVPENVPEPPTANNGQRAGGGHLLGSAGPRVTRRCPQASSEPTQPPCGRAEPAPGRTHRQHRRTCRSRRRSSTVTCKRDETVRQGDHEEAKVAFSIRLMGRVSLVSSGKAAGECQRTYRGVVAPLSRRLAPKIRRNLHLRATRVALVSAHLTSGKFRGGQDMV